VTPKNSKPGLSANDIVRLAPEILELLRGVNQLELENVTLEIAELDLFLPSGAFASGRQPEAASAPERRPRPSALVREQFTQKKADYPGKIREVMLGATKAEGGTRGCSLTIGGATTPAYADRSHLPPHAPVISLDVFDMPVSLPAALRANVGEVMNDPAEWAKMNVAKFGADVVTVHLMSTDPLLRDAPVSSAVKTVEEVLQAVDVPLIIGGCGDPKKDAAVFTAIAEMARGERLLLNSVTLDMAEAKLLQGVATSAKENGHVLLAFTGLELNNAKELNRRLYEYIPPEQIVMDLTTVALGYGLEYSFTIHERARYAALMGDQELAHPVISAATNAWAAREAWMKMGTAYGPRELRGPLWETLNAVTLLLAGIDLFLMMHPAAVLTLRDVMERMARPDGTGVPVFTDWTGVQL
jgi:acetyl-CoA decarbonylase/synthase complex subunit delta